jgi:peptidoglycan hydrolase CwlO-like protein
MKKKMFSGLLILTVLSVMPTMSGCCKKYITQIDDQKTQLDQANSRIDALQDQTQDLNNRLDQAKSSLKQAEREKRELASSVDSLNSKIAELERQKKPRTPAKCGSRLFLG